jgi:hypothetical protein
MKHAMPQSETVLDNIYGEQFFKFVKKMASNTEFPTSKNESFRMDSHGYERYYILLLYFAYLQFLIITLSMVAILKDMYL